MVGFDGWINKEEPQPKKLSNSGLGAAVGERSVITSVASWPSPEARP